MPLHKKTISVCLILLAFCVSCLSATPSPTAAGPLSQIHEEQTVGGSACASAWGLGAGLAVAALSPCSVLCAVFAWYDLALIGAFCN